MLKILKSLFTKQQKTKAGNELPLPPSKLTECYSSIDDSHRWQGDVYPKSKFDQNKLPNPSIPYWMLVNRTCHLYEGGDRKPKLQYLNYAAVYPLKEFLDYGDKAPIIKNQISSLIKRNESVLFLPSCPDQNIETPLIVNFNLLYTFKIEGTPHAREKILQLSSPFCEHAFQKFSRYFYTVGYDDTALKSKSYIEELAAQYPSKD